MDLRVPTRWVFEEYDTLGLPQGCRSNRPSYLLEGGVLGRLLRSLSHTVEQ